MRESDNSPQGQGVNPAWNEFFEAIPEDFREDVQPAITPILEKWDQGVQKRFEQYKPYERYANEKIDPNVLDYGLNLMESLNSNEGAMQVYEQLSNYLDSQGLLDQEEDEEEEEEGEFDWDSLPPQLRKQIEQLQSGFGTLAEAQLMERQKQIEAEEDAALDAELKGLKEKHGDFDDEWVLVKMMNGMEPEEAVRAYQGWVDKVLQEKGRPRNTFRPLGSGSGDFPSGNGQFDSKKASDREVTDLITQMLMDTNRNK